MENEALLYDNNDYNFGAQTTSITLWRKRCPSLGPSIPDNDYNRALLMTIPFQEIVFSRPFLLAIILMISHDVVVVVVVVTVFCFIPLFDHWT